MYVWNRGYSLVVYTSNSQAEDTGSIPGRDTRWVRLKNPVQRLWRTHPSPGLAGEAGSPTLEQKPTGS